MLEEFGRIISETLSLFIVMDMNGKVTHINENGQKVFNLDIQNNVFIKDILEADGCKVLDEIIASNPSDIVYKKISMKNLGEVSVKILVKENVYIFSDVSFKVDTAKSDESRFLSSILDNIPHMIFVKDAIDLRFKLFNKAGEELLGQPMENLIGKNDFDFFPIDQAKFFQEKDYSVLKGKKQILIEKEEIETPHGKRYLRTKKVPILNDDNTPRFLMGISEDITEMINLEKHALHTSKLASIGEMAAGVGHEINNPLAIIMGYLSTLQHKFSSSDTISSKEFHKYYNKINLACERIRRVVHSLRSFSRSDTNDLGVVDLLEVLDESLAMTQEIYENEGINFKFKIDRDNSYKLFANRGKIQLIFMNLFSNSRDATKNSKNKIITIEAFKEGTENIFIVSDTGIGMDHETMAKIFDPFFTTKDVHEGTGIGLSHVYNIILELKGKIQVKSEIGKGSSFIVSIPNCYNFIEEEASVENITDKDISGKKILVIDDEDDILETMELMLTDRGALVKVFNKAENALVYIAENFDTVDLVISDVKMPNMDGFRFLEEFKKIKNINKKIKFVFSSGGVSINLEKFSEENSDYVSGYIYKPFSTKQVIELIDKIL